MNERLAIAAILAVDYINRRDNYDEMVERLEEHISRWERNIEKIENSKDKIRENINNNRASLAKAGKFLINLESEKSIEWYEKQKWASEHHRSEKVRESALNNITEHDEKLRSVKKRIDRLNSWIEEGKERVESMNSSIEDLESKISSANSKINS